MNQVMQSEPVRDLIRAILSLFPENISISSAVRLLTADAISFVRGYISFVSIGSGSFRLKSILIVIISYHDLVLYSC